MLRTPFFMANPPGCAAMSSCLSRLYLALVASGYWHGMIHRTVARERRHGGGNETAQIKPFHFTPPGHKSIMETARRPVSKTHSTSMRSQCRENVSIPEDTELIFQICCTGISGAEPWI